jgi:hypothetical protein
MDGMHGIVSIIHRHDPGRRYECWVTDCNSPWGLAPIYWMPLPDLPLPKGGGDPVLLHEMCWQSYRPGGIVKFHNHRRTADVICGRYFSRNWCAFLPRLQVAARRDVVPAVLAYAAPPQERQVPAGLYRR